MKIKGFKKNQEGATAVEFAITFLAVITIIFGIIELSLILYNKAMLSNACREGTRAAVLFSWPNRINNAEIDDVVKNYSEKNLILFNDSGYHAAIINPPICVQGEFITVSLDYDYDWVFFPFGKIPLDVKSTMRCE